jgi:hypothetical protein
MTGNALADLTIAASLLEFNANDLRMIEEALASYTPDNLDDLLTARLCEARLRDAVRQKVEELSK